MLIFLLTLTASRRTGVSDLNGEQVRRSWEASAQPFPGDACSCSSVAMVRLTTLQHSEVRHNQGNLAVNLKSYSTPDFLLHFALNNSKLKMGRGILFMVLNSQQFPSLSFELRWISKFYRKQQVKILVSRENKKKTLVEKIKYNLLLIYSFKTCILGLLSSCLYSRWRFLMINKTGRVTTS